MNERSWIIQGVPENSIPSFKKIFKKYKTNSDSNDNTCNVTVDVSSTYPVSIIEMSCFVSVYDDITENRWKTLLISAAQMSNRLKKTQNNWLTHGFLSCILMIIKRLLYSIYSPFRTQNYSYRICNLSVWILLPSMNKIWYENSINWHPKKFQNIHKMCHLTRSKMKGKGDHNNLIYFWYILFG